ncbi:hypothetical protein DRO21_06365, partial [archaeon]
MAQRAAERLISIYREVYEEVLDRKLKELKRFNQGILCVTHIHNLPVNWCGGWDLNPRRPTPEDLK